MDTRSSQSHIVSGPLLDISALPQEEPGDHQATSAEEVRERVRRSFAGGAADTVLRALDCAAEWFGAEIDDHIRAADVMLHTRADHIVVTSALLASLRRNGGIRPDEIRSLFGEMPAALVERVYAEDIPRTASEAHRREDTRRLLKAISSDIRAVILRLGLRLAELERLARQSDDGRREIAQQTLELYVPLADRMGMSVLRGRLEDICFQILEPQAYEELAQSIRPTQDEDKMVLEVMENGVRQLLARSGVNGRVYGRTKGLYSLYRKMCRLGCAPQEIMDRIGLRVIVSSVEECYTVLELLHTHFRPIPGTFDDYISSPKENGYRSLHTCVYPVPDASQRPVEFQIRTEAMHRQAEFGIAAHWLYKSDEEAEADCERRLEWLRGLLRHHEEAATHAEFVEHLRRQVFGEQNGEQNPSTALKGASS